MLEEVKRKINSLEYDFLKTNEHLGKNIILLGLGGSYAYGTNTPESDLDIRGIALNTKREILDGKYLDKNNQPIPEFYGMVDEFEKKLNYAAKNTELPDKPDYKRIDEFIASVNERVIRGELNNGDV